MVLVFTSFSRPWEHRTHRYWMVVTMISIVNPQLGHIMVNYLHNEKYSDVLDMSRLAISPITMERCIMHHLMINIVVFSSKKLLVGNEDCFHYRILVMVPDALLISELPSRWFLRFGSTWWSPAYQITKDTLTYFFIANQVVEFASTQFLTRVDLFFTPVFYWTSNISKSTTDLQCCLDISVSPWVFGCVDYENLGKEPFW
jgi:hypothetical protein